MSINSRNIKNGLLTFLNAVGMFRLMRWINRNSVIILFVHGVVDKNEPAAWKPLRPPLDVEVFRKQIEIISRYYNFVSYDDAVEMIAGNRSILPNSIAISFDDGYYNNMQCALPALEDFDVKPMFFVATGFSNNRKTFWFDRFDYIIQQIKEDVELAIGPRTFVFAAGNRIALQRTYAEFRACAKESDWTDREFISYFDQVCDELEEKSGKSLAQIQSSDIVSATLTDDNMAQLRSTDRADIGSHTIDHVRLDKENHEECLKQIAQSKEVIEAITSEVCRHFSYPNGGVNTISRGLVESSGYASACTAESGFNQLGDDLFLLKRIHLPERAESLRLLNLLSGSSALQSALKNSLSTR